MKRKFGKFICFVSIIFFLLCSCSTTLKMNITRPAKLDLKGAKTIGVLSFAQSNRFPFYSSGISIGSDYESYSKVNSVERQVINYIHSELEKNLMNSPYVQLVSSEAVEKALRGKIKNPADVYISGEMVTFNIFDEENVVKKEIEPEKNEKSPDKPKYVYEKFYTREILLVFNYQVVDSNSDNVLYFDTLKINSRSDPVELLKELPNPYYMIEYDLQSFVSDFLQKLQPYNITRNISLLDDKSKNPMMEEADKLAKDGKLKESFNKFYSIYNQTGLFEAGYNAAMILMVLGDFEKAEALMNRVYFETGNEKASKGLSDIMNEIRQKNILDSQINSRKTKEN